jgi:hypothetical protein
VTFTDYQKLRVAADGLIEELEHPPKHLRFTEDTIYAYDGDGRCVGQVKWSGTSAGAGSRWDSKHKCDVTLHVHNINATA